VNFVTFEFAAFFAVVFTVYWLLPRRAQNLFLLVASWVFYAAWDWRFLGLIIFSSGLDFVAGRKIDEAPTRSGRRRWLLVSLTGNLGILAYFKYTNFFLDSLGALADSVGWHLSMPTLQVILPVGISFYTFQTLSYTIDIYLGRLKPTRSLVDFAAFVAFFPQLVAGPIVRAREFLYQLEERRHFSSKKFEAGAIRFLAGFFKKAFIADTLAIHLVDPVFADPTSFGSGALWLALFGYTAQIYADFSGYSSMAIGMAGMLGFDLPENFRFPYLARDFSEFWRRWHITMSRFFRDYVYIPLGGSRGSATRTRWNLAVTTLVSGLWHGASWTFVAWGGLHGVYIMLTHVVRSRTGDEDAKGGAAFVGWALTFLGAMLAWILFRAQSFPLAWAYLTGLVGAHGAAVAVSPMVWVAFAAFLFDHAWGFVEERALVGPGRVPALVQGVAYAAMIVFLYHAKPQNPNPFIYFQF
jgi:D-alanyl-lipoteichoic acid acyltransferase DltB (MBOAT superfamily)